MLLCFYRVCLVPLQILFIAAVCAVPSVIRQCIVLRQPCTQIRRKLPGTFCIQMRLIPEICCKIDQLRLLLLIKPKRNPALPGPVLQRQIRCPDVSDNGLCPLPSRMESWQYQFCIIFLTKASRSFFQIFRLSFSKSDASSGKPRILHPRNGIVDPCPSQIRLRMKS